MASAKLGAGLAGYHSPCGTAQRGSLNRRPLVALGSSHHGASTEGRRRRAGRSKRSRHLGHPTTWDANADTYDGTWGHGLKTDQERLAWSSLLSRMFPPSESLTIIDVGCGTGVVALLLAGV